MTPDGRVRQPVTRAGDRAASRPWPIGVLLGALLTAVLAVATAVLIVAAPDAPLGEAWGVRGFAAVLGVAFSAVGALIGLKVPGHRIGALLLLIGVWACLTGFVIEYAAFAIAVHPGSLPFAYFVGWLATWVWVPFATLATTFLLLLFPTGRLISARWRPAAALSALGILFICVLLALYPGEVDNAPYIDNPLVIPRAWEQPVVALTYVAFVVLALAIVLSALSLVVRYRRSTGIARQQLKWFASAAVFAGLTFAGPGTLVNILLAGNPRNASLKVTEILTILSLATIPIATGIAILRYHLYEIDRVLSRTISWAVVSVLLVALFVGLILALQGLLSPLTGGSTVAVAASTLLVASLAQGITRRVQAAVDRRFFRARYDSSLTVDSFAARLRSEVDLAAIRGDVVETISGTVRPSQTGLWIRGGGL
jgi:hypothetical protein